MQNEIDLTIVLLDASTICNTWKVLPPKNLLIILNWQRLVHFQLTLALVLFFHKPLIVSQKQCPLMALNAAQIPHSCTAML